MSKVSYVEYNGVSQEFDVPCGNTVMQGAVSNQVRGILAECGGVCSCATCHVYVESAWLTKTGPKSPAEKALLEDVVDAQPNGRLSCQIKVTEELDGLIVRLPARQV